MFQQARTFRAMLDLGRFTVDEVVERAGVPPATVRTVIGRNRHMLADVGRVPTNRRGGAPKVWELRPDASEQLQRSLGELVALREAPTKPRSEPNTVPPGLAAALEILVRRVPEESSEADRASLAASARTLRAGAARDLSSRGSEPAGPRARLRVVDILLRLADAEQRSDRDAWLGLSRELDAVRGLLVAAGEAPLYDEARSRLDTSAIAHAKPAAERLRDAGLARGVPASVIMQVLAMSGLDLKAAHAAAAAAAPEEAFAAALLRRLADDLGVEVKRPEARPFRRIESYRIDSAQLARKEIISDGPTPKSAIAAAAAAVTTRALQRPSRLRGGGQLVAIGGRSGSGLTNAVKPLQQPLQINQRTKA